MTTQTLTRADDAWVDSAHTGRLHGSDDWVRVGGASRVALVDFAIGNILGRTVTSAPLSFHVGPGHAGQTYTIKRATSDWSDDDVKWSNRPSVGSTSVTATVSALVDGSMVTVDVTTLLQQVADGQTWYGFWITSDAGTEQLIYADDSGQPAWELTVNLSDNPETPQGLFPDVGAVGASKVILGWLTADLDGATGQADYKVQFSATDNFAAPDNDTGWLAGTLPRHDMTAYAYALTSGVSTGWRVKTRDAAGRESDWSDTAHVTYDNALGALVLDSPASTTFGDPTLRVQGHLTASETIKKWRIRVARGDDRTAVIYDSREQPGDSSGLLDFELPFRDPKSGRRVFPDDQPRWLNVRVWGSKKRSVAEGRSDFVETWVLVTANDSLGVAAPSSLTVTPVGTGDPRYTYTWALASAPDGVLVEVGNDIVARLDASDYAVSSGTYTYTDDGLLAPWQANAVRVRAVVGGNRSARSNTVTVTPQVKGRWIITTDPDIGAIVLDEASGDSIASVDTTSVAKKLDGSDYAVTYGPPWIGGTFTGAVKTIEDFTRLELLRKRPDLRPRFVWGTRSIRARLGDLSPMPDAAFMPNHPTHVVSMSITQVED